MKLINATQIAEIIGKSERYTKENIIFRIGFPDCFDLGKDSRLWDKADIEKWIRSHRRPVKRKKRSTTSQQNQSKCKLITQI